MAAIAVARPRIEPAPVALPDARPFLAATWSDFLMLSYEIEPRVLTPFVPLGTELDLWNRTAYISLVGFQFRDAQLYGVRVPFHQDFAEVNLRFYVRRRVGDAWRRGVVFLREICPKRAVGAVARWIYGENFRRVSLACHADRDSAKPQGDCQPPQSIEYTWRHRGAHYRLTGEVLEPPHAPPPDSLAEFVVDHYWAYTFARNRTTEYPVPHAPWQIAAAEAEFTGDPWRLYGPRFAPFLRGEPASAFWASGSPIGVYRGIRLET
jgi:uncharacterized protein